MTRQHAIDDHPRPAEQAPADRWITALLLIGAPTVLILGALAVCPGSRCTIPALDQAGLALAESLQRQWLTTVMTVITWAGSLWLLAPLALWLANREMRRQAMPAALLAPLALTGATVMAQTVKWWTDRPRPVEQPLIALPLDASFPSAHAMQITVLALVWLGAGRSPAAWLLAAVLIGLVGFSRIYLQVHFVTDVIAGTLAALIWVTALQRVIPRTGRSR